MRKTNFAAAPNSVSSDDGQYDPNAEYEENRDKSYNFAFEEAASRRQETADEAGNVRGQYSYVNAEGNEIVVRYSASRDGGFVVEHEEELAKSVEKATLDGAAAVAAVRAANQQQQQQQGQAYEAAAAPAAFDAAAGQSGFVRAPVVIPVANTRAQVAGT